MRKINWLIVVLMLVLMPVSASATLVRETEEEILSIAEPMLDTVLKAMETLDYELYKTAFADNQSIAKDKFEETTSAIVKSAGNYETRTYLGVLDYQDMTLVLWKSRFSGTAKDVLIKLYLSEKDGVVKIAGLWFN